MSIASLVTAVNASAIKNMNILVSPCEGFFDSVVILRISSVLWVSVVSG